MEYNLSMEKKVTDLTDIELGLELNNQYQRLSFVQQSIGVILSELEHRKADIDAKKIKTD